MPKVNLLIADFKALEGNGVTVDINANDKNVYIVIKHNGETASHYYVRSFREMEHVYIDACNIVNNINFIKEVKEVLNARK